MTGMRYFVMSFVDITPKTCRRTWEESRMTAVLAVCSEVAVKLQYTFSHMSPSPYSFAAKDYCLKLTNDLPEPCGPLKIA